MDFSSFWTWFWLIYLGLIAWLVYDSLRERRSGYLTKSRLRPWRIIDEWFFLMEGGQGQGEKIMKEAERKLKSLLVPDLKQEYKEVSLGLLSRILKGSRKFLVVENSYLKGYEAFIGAHDYGNQLTVSWYLTLNPTWLGRITAFAINHAVAGLILWLVIWPVRIILKIFAKGRGSVIPELMDLFDKEELRAYATTVHGATKDATMAVMKDFNLNYAKVEWHTRGLLNLN